MAVEPYAAHDPEQAVAVHLSGSTDPAERAVFSEHLLACDACWHELQAAERGRRLVESARVVAPVSLRDRLRAHVEAEPASAAGAPLSSHDALPGPRRGQPLRGAPRRLLMTAACLVVALALAGTTWVVLRPASPLAGEPAALVEAVADYRDGALPGRMLPTERAPDLSMLSLSPVGAAGGDYEGLAVDGYAYRDGAGRRLVIYLSKEPFPTAAGARQLTGPDGPWTAERGDIVMLCARAPHALLVVGQDAQLVRGVADQLGVL